MFCIVLLLAAQTLTPAQLVLPCRCTWEDPYGGTCADTFELSPCGGTLTQHTDMAIRARGGERSQYKTVYRRRAGGGAA